MNEGFERKCVLWPSGRCRMWESDQNTVTQERTTASIFYLGYRKNEHCGGTRSLFLCTPRELCIAQKEFMRNGCLVSTYLGNDQAMLFVDGVGRYRAAAKLQGGGS